MSQSHLFEGTLQWTGSAVERDGKLALARAFVIDFPGVPSIEGSSPAVFNGDDSRHNPETLMVASLMACHHLTYLAVCERAGIRITAYRDRGLSGFSSMLNARPCSSNSITPYRCGSLTG